MIWNPNTVVYSIQFRPGVEKYLEMQMCINFDRRDINELIFEYPAGYPVSDVLTLQCNHSPNLFIIFNYTFNHIRLIDDLVL